MKWYDIVIMIIGYTIGYIIGAILAKILFYGGNI